MELHLFCIRNVNVSDERKEIYSIYSANETRKYYTIIIVICKSTNDNNNNNSRVRIMLCV